MNSKRRTLNRLTNKLAREKSFAASAGYYGGGSVFASNFRDRVAPNPRELVECFRGIVYACATINADAVARTPLRLYATTSGSERKPKAYAIPRPVEKKQLAYIRKTYAQDLRIKAASNVDEITQSPLIDLMANPCREFDLSMLLQIMTLSMDILPASYTYMGSPVLGVPNCLKPMLSQYVLPIPNVTFGIGGIRDNGSDREESAIDSYTYFGDRFLPVEVLRVRHLSLGNPYVSGHSPAEAAWQYIDLTDKNITVQGALLTNGAKPSGMISPKSGDTPMASGDESVKRVLFDINNRFAGANNGRVVFLPGGLGFTPFDWPPSDLAAMAIEERAVERICACFHVPVSFIKTDDVNRANAEAGHAQHARFAVDPRCVAIASALTHQVARKVDPRLFFAFDNPVPDDEEQSTKVFDMRLKNASTTINEYRESLGEPPVEWGDKPLQYPSLRDLGDNPEPVAANAVGKPESKPGRLIPLKSTKAATDPDGEPVESKLPPPADDMPDGEENAFDLPQGEVLTATMRQWYTRQAAQVLSVLPGVMTIDEAMPVDLSEYNGPMQAVAVPILMGIWEAAGKSLKRRLAEPLLDWRVTSPDVHDAIEEQAGEFVESTNQTTEKLIAKAVEQTQQEIISGDVLPDDADDVLMAKIKLLFATLVKVKAPMIGENEASRAYHLASLDVAKKSKVITGKYWKCAPGACYECRSVEKNVGTVGLEEDFIINGKNQYAKVVMAPLHPKCRCTIVYAIDAQHIPMMPDQEMEVLA